MTDACALKSIDISPCSNLILMSTATARCFALDALQHEIIEEAKHTSCHARKWLVD